MKEQSVVGGDVMLDMYLRRLGLFIGFILILVRMVAENHVMSHDIHKVDTEVDRRLG